MEAQIDAMFAEPGFVEQDITWDEESGGQWTRRVDMCRTCNYAQHMSKMIQIRNVPDEIHRKLKVRAAEAGRSLSDYLLAEIARAAERPTPRELRARIRSRDPVTPGVPPAAAIRQERDRR